MNKGFKEAWEAFIFTLFSLVSARKERRLIIHSLYWNSLTPLMIANAWSRMLDRKVEKFYLPPTLSGHCHTPSALEPAVCTEWSAGWCCQSQLWHREEEQTSHSSPRERKGNRLLFCARRFWNVRIIPACFCVLITQLIHSPLQIPTSFLFVQAYQFHPLIWSSQHFVCISLFVCF